MNPISDDVLTLSSRRNQRASMSSPSFEKSAAGNSDADAAKPAETTARETATDESSAASTANDSRREHYIPISKIDLFELLPDCGDLSPQEQQRFHEVCMLLDAMIHYRYHVRLTRLMQIYSHLDPDKVTIHTSEISELLRDSLTDQFFDEVHQLLEKANYVRLNDVEVQEAVEAASQLGVQLRVDLDIFRRLEVYARGSDVETWSRRSWRKYFRVVDFDVDVYRRLIVAFRLCDPEPGRQKRKESGDFAYIKTFKNIPHSDLGVLLPGTRVKMSLMDRSKLIVPTISGMAINIFKAWRALALVAVFASLFNFFSWMGLLIACVIYLVRAFFGYSRTQKRHQLNLTQHLYFQNLDSNKGGLYRILHEAEEQDFREAAVAYFVLWQHADAMSADELDAACEKLLKQITDHDIDFEVDDALSKLSELKIAIQNDHGTWKTLEPEAALLRLDQTWDEIFPYFQFQSQPPQSER